MSTRPTATSTLSVTPLAKLLAHATQRSLTGTVVIETPDHQKSAIYFEAGCAAKVMTSVGVHFLGEVLQDLGLIDEATHRETVAQAVAARRLHGQVLTSSGKLTPQDLKISLREQIQRKVAWLSTLPPQSVAGYYDQQNLLERWGGPDSTPVTAVTLIWPCTRDVPDNEDLDKTLAKLDGRILRLHREAQVATFKLDRNEQALLDVMRAKPQSLAELRSSGFDERLIRRLVYAFAIAHFLDLGSKAPAPMTAAAPRASTTSRVQVHTPPSRRSPPASPPHPPVGRTDADAEAFRAEVHARHATIDKQSLYEILGVDPKSPTTAIQAAFFQHARRWHPDRIGPDLADVREQAQKIFSRMSEAHASLVDPERRAEYDRVLKEGGGTAEEQDKINAIVRAASAFQKAEILHKRGRLKEAEVEAKLAFEGDPEQAEYGALYAWIRAQQLETRDTEAFAPLIVIANKAAEREKEHIRIRYYRGMVLKRAGRADLALRDFRFIVGKDPHHTDAQRELRLAKMRKNDPTSDRPSAPEGILGRFFKKQ